MKSQSTNLRFPKKFLLPFLLTVVISGLGGCASPGKRTAIGTGTGAAAGAIIGGLTGGKKGALIGAAIGAAAGAGFGNYLDKRHQELAKVAEAKKTEDGLVLSLKGDILFDTGSSALKKESIDNISQLGDILAKYPQDKLQVIGHTDNTGKNIKNEELSKARATSVREVLISRGVKESQLLTIGAGSAQPIGDNKTAGGRSANRRVEINIDMPEAKEANQG